MTLLVLSKKNQVSERLVQALCSLSKVTWLLETSETEGSRPQALVLAIMSKPKFS